MTLKIPSRKDIPTGKKLPLRRILTILKNCEVTILRRRNLIRLEFKHQGIVGSQIEMLESFVSIYSINFKDRYIEGSIREYYQEQANRLIKELSHKHMGNF